MWLRPDKVALLLAATAAHGLDIPSAPSVNTEDLRVWAIGDLHGDVGCARHWVERTGLVGNLSAPPDSWSWRDPAGQLIFMGDYIDRGPDSRAVLELVRELTLRFPGRVHALLGNHELNLLVDRSRSPGGGRYLEYAYAAAHPAQYMHWLDEQEEGTEDILRSLHDALLTVYQRNLHGQGVVMSPDSERSIVQYVQPQTARSGVARALRRWQEAYMRGVSSRTALGSWMLRPLTIYLADTLFVHAGLSESILAMQLPASSSPSRPLGSLAALDELNARWLNATQPPESDAQAEPLAVAHSPLLELATELVEYRGLHEAYAWRYKDEHLTRGSSARQMACTRVGAVLRTLNVSRIAVGHTPEDSVRIQCGGRLLALDSTLSRSFRAHGNYYCNARMEKLDPRICPPRKEACEGQIVRLERADPDAAWLLHVVESAADREHAEGGVDDRKVELR